MLRGRLLRFSLAAAALTAPGAALAQPVERAQATIAAATDLRERGISWSGGAAALSASASLPVANGFSLAAGAATTRGSARHGGADLSFSGEARIVRTLGAVRLSAAAIGHGFRGAQVGGLGYGEIDASAAFLIGPADLVTAVSYAPSQDAIGGSNLYLSAGANVALPGSPIAISARIGRSSGTITDVDRSRRLRPDDRYWDYRVGIEHVRGPIGIGVDFTATSIDRRPAARFDAGDSGSRVTARARLFL